MPRSIPSSDLPPDRVAQHKASLLRTLFAMCENLRKLQTEPAARQACLEVSSRLREELRELQREERR